MNSSELHGCVFRVSMVMVVACVWKEENIMSKICKKFENNASERKTEIIFKKIL